MEQGPPRMGSDGACLWFAFTTAQSSRLALKRHLFTKKYDLAPGRPSADTPRHRIILDTAMYVEKTPFHKIKTDLAPGRPAPHTPRHHRIILETAMYV